MPVIQTINLPTFLPFPGESLKNSFPPNHDSLSAMLGLCLAYLNAMHPAKLVQPNESMRASAHLISLFINDPLAQSLLPKSPHSANTPAKELNSLQIRLTSLENTLANLAKATTEVRKDLKARPNPTPATTKPQATQRQGPLTPQTYAAKVSTPQRPSIVVDVASIPWPDNKRPTPADICATINTTLALSNATQTHVSAARWTSKGNLVIWGGNTTSANQLNSALPHFVEAIQSSISVLTSTPLHQAPTLRPNVKWSKLRFNAVPTGKTAFKGAYSPDEAHKALTAENPAYASLTVTQKLSWVCNPSSYSKGTISSLAVSFEDPDGTSTQALLRQWTLYAFGNIITIKRWKQTPPKHTTATTKTPSNPIPAVRITPLAETQPQPSVYTAPIDRSQLSPEEFALHLEQEDRLKRQRRGGPAT